MPNNTPFWDIILLKLLAFLPKVFAAVIGAILGLMLSGDIGNDEYARKSRGRFNDAATTAARQ